MSQLPRNVPQTVSEQVLYTTLTIHTHNEKVAMAIAITIIRVKANSPTKEDNTNFDKKAEYLNGCVFY